MKKVWRLGETYSLLHLFDSRIEMAVSHIHIEPAVEVIVEEETTEAERQQTFAAYFRLRRFVNEQAIPFVVVERHHLV